MKKILSAILVVILACACFSFVACGSDKKVDSISINKDSLPKDVKRGDKINYSKITIEVKLANGKTKTLALTDKDVEHTDIDTSKAGQSTLTVTYGGKSDQIAISVRDITLDDYTIIAFKNATGYLDYISAKGTKENKQTEFYNQDVPYTVGNTNGYLLLPVAMVKDSDNQERQNTGVKTTYKLSVKDNGSYVAVEGDDIADYISNAENNVYYFTDAAVGHQFKMEVTLAASYKTSASMEEKDKTITQEFRVVKGYNVYDALGLSVLDNLNTNSWRGIKESTTLAWDDGHNLAYWADKVDQVIIHNNITVSKNDLPANYFWVEGETKLEGAEKSVSYEEARSNSPDRLVGLLKGSLKETYLGEAWEEYEGDWQRGLYTNNGIGISGNYLKLSYDSGLQPVGDGKYSAPNGGIYVIYDYEARGGDKSTFPRSHWNFMVSTQFNGSEPYVKTCKDSVTVENVYFVGEANRSESVERPAGIVTMNLALENDNVNNVIANSWYINVAADRNNCVLTLTDCKFYDSFSQMLYLHHTKVTNINRCEFKGAGGPIITLNSITSDPEDDCGLPGGISTRNVPEVNISADSILESYLTGTESWFVINIGEGASSIVSQLLGLTQPVENSTGKVYHKNEKGADYYNLTMIIIPGPSDVFSSEYELLGQLKVGEHNYGMDEPVYNALMNMNAIGAEGKALATELLAVLNQLQAAEAFGDLSDTIADVTMMQAGFEQVADMSPLHTLRAAPVFKSGNNYAIVSDPESGSTFDIFGTLSRAQVGDLCDGVAETVENLEEFTMVPDETTAATAKVLLAKWQAFQAKIAALATQIENAADWAANWTANTTCHDLAMWVNPVQDAGIGYHFIVMFKECA